jgi:hypothetical protein
MVLASLGLTEVVGAKKVLVLVLETAIACLIAVHGWLLVFRPDLFLKFYDWENRGMRWNKSADWRRNVHNTEYKIVGALFLLFGMLFLGMLARVFLLGTGVHVYS